MAWEFGDDPITGKLTAGKKLLKGDLKGALNEEIRGETFGQVPNLTGSISDGFDAIGKAWDKPYDDAAEANRRAGEDLKRVGQTGYDMTQQGLGRALDQTLPTARVWENTYGADGALAGPGALERRYEDVRNGADPVSDRARELGEQSISNAFSARGLNNSGAALKAIGNLNKDVIADRERRLDNLAGGAQGAAETRLGGAFDRINNFTQGRANTVANLTDSAVSNYTSGQVGGVNANLAAANVGLQKRKDTMGLVGQGLGYVFG